MESIKLLKEFLRRNLYFMSSIWQHREESNAFSLNPRNEIPFKTIRNGIKNIKVFEERSHILPILMFFGLISVGGIFYFEGISFVPKFGYKLMMRLRRRSLFGCNFLST